MSIVVERLKLGFTSRCPRCGKMLRLGPRKTKAKLNPDNSYKKRYWCKKCGKWIKKEPVGE